MINRANCNLKLSKLWLLTALAWRGSYLSHNSIFKEQQSVSTQNSYAQNSFQFPIQGTKIRVPIYYFPTRQLRFRVLGARRLSQPHRLSTWFSFFSLPSPYRRRTNKLSGANFEARVFWKFFGVFFTNEIKAFTQLAGFEPKIFRNSVPTFSA